MKILEHKLTQVLPYILVAVGIIGFLAALIITEEKSRLLQDPSYRPSCSIGPILSCGSVMESDQAKFFGFPNTYIGLVAFPILAIIGAAMLARKTFKRWFWLGVNLGTLLGTVFVHYLFFQSVYRINALCLYCIAVWIVTITSFIYVTLYNLHHDHLRFPRQLIGLETFIKRHHGDILAGWLLIIAGLILHHFWYYFGSLI